MCLLKYFPNFRESVHFIKTQVAFMYLRRGVYAPEAYLISTFKFLLHVGLKMLESKKRCVILCYH